MSATKWWQRRCGGGAPAGYGTPIILGEQPIRGLRYGLHWAYAPPGGGPCLLEEATWRNVAGVLVNTPRGRAWLYFRRWAA